MYGAGSGARSPPPLQHPRPKHPPSQIPSTSPPPPEFDEHGGGGYQRFQSPPIHSVQQQHYSNSGARAPVHQPSQLGPGGASARDGYNSSLRPGQAQQQHPMHQQQHHLHQQQQQQWSPMQQHGGGYPDAYIPAGHAGPSNVGYSTGGDNVQHFSGSAPPPHVNAAGGQSWLTGSVGGENGGGWPGMGMGMNDATAAMGVQFGKHAFDAGQAYIDKNFVRLLPLAHLKHSFNVSNSYVLKKLRLVLWPWRHRPWSRAVKRSESSGVAEGWKPPRDDINCPDLYIPVMALVTYILLSAIIAGKQGQFDPRILGQTASKSFGILFLEFLCIKLGCYLLGIGEDGTVVDMLSYEGYKFVGVIVTLLGGLVGLKGWSYWGIFGYVFLANFFFQLRSLRHIVLPDPTMTPLDLDHTGNSTANASTGVSHGQRARRIQFLFVVAAAQGLSMFILVKF